jgi:hypothetical protein
MSLLAISLAWGIALTLKPKTKAEDATAKEISDSLIGPTDPDKIFTLFFSSPNLFNATLIASNDPCTSAVAEGDERNMAMLSSSLVANIGAHKRTVEDGFVELLDGPTGFMAIKRGAFEKLEEKFPELNCKNDHQNRDFDEYCAVFDCMIDPDSRRYLSEDYAFCRRWQQCDGKIYADINTTLGHVGNLPFSGCLNDRLKA